jgi:rod shape-determining protein MreC|tara:strand:+ start:1465 stop:2307 length:843 start_codon:yes stop_codon:yes gene_type:complete
MASSRDDFVIAVRSAFLKKSNKQQFSLLALILFSIFLIFLSNLNYVGIKYIKIGVNEATYRLSSMVSYPEKKINDSLRFLSEYFNVYKENQNLKNQIDKLNSKKLNYIFLENENKKLKELIGENIYNSEGIISKVLIGKEGKYLKSIILNKGSRDGIKKGMVVLEKNYLIGQIIEVNYTTSRAILISDLNSNIPVVLEPGSFQSILSGTGKDYGKIKYSKNKLILDEKTIVYTSGSGGNFRAGLPIGKINNNLETFAVEFFSDLSQITYVIIQSIEGQKE